MFQQNQTFFYKGVEFNLVLNTGTNVFDRKHVMPLIQQGMNSTLACFKYKDFILFEDKSRNN